MYFFSLHAIYSWGELYIVLEFTMPTVSLIDFLISKLLLLITLTKSFVTYFAGNWRWPNIWHQQSRRGERDLSTRFAKESFGSPWGSTGKKNFHCWSTSNFSSQCYSICNSSKLVRLCSCLDLLFQPQLV